VRQAYLEAPLSVREVLEKNNFVDAVADTDIRWKILQTRPGTIQKALAVATEVEAFQISEQQRLRPGQLIGNNNDEQRGAFDSSISKILSEMKKD